MDYKPLYTVQEAAKILHVGKNSVYELIRAGQLPAIKLGALKIRGDDLHKFINGLPCVQG